MIYKYTFQLSNRLFLNADLWFQVAETACPKNERFKDNIRVGSVAVGKEPKPAPKAVSKLFCPQNRGLTFYGLCQNTGVLRSHWSRVTLRTNLAMGPDGVGFHGDSVDELKEAFHEAVDDYVETCAKIGKEPQKPYSGRVMFRVDPEVHRKAALAAELSGKSLNQWAEEVLNHAARGGQTA